MLSVLLFVSNVMPARLTFNIQAFCPAALEETRESLQFVWRSKWNGSTEQDFLLCVLAAAVPAAEKRLSCHELATPSQEQNPSRETGMVVLKSLLLTKLIEVCMLHWQDWLGATQRRSRVEGRDQLGIIFSRRLHREIIKGLSQRAYFLPFRGKSGEDVREVHWSVLPQRKERLEQAGELLRWPSRSS